MQRVRNSKLYLLEKKETNFNKNLEVINNGKDNLYPDIVERIANNSNTAKSCARLMVNYLYGRGFANEVKLGKTSLNDGAKIIAKNIVDQYGVFINISYNANFMPSDFKILPYTYMRKGKKDSEKYVGKYAYCENWAEAKNSDIRWFHSYNPIKEIVKAQIELEKGETLAEKVENYKGQVIYVNLTHGHEYALSIIDPVLRDCDSESQVSIYTNRSLRRGFFGKQVVLTHPLVGEIEDYREAKEFHKATNERDNFRETLEQMLGAENSGDVAHFEMELQDGEKLDDIFKVINIESNIDDKLFADTKTSVFKNILMAYNSIPPALVRPDNSVFSASGDSINAMRRVYFDNTQNERDELQKIINRLCKIFKQDEQQLIPLFDVSN
jgi:hypothetical protein